MPRRLALILLVIVSTVLAFTASTLYSSQPGADAMREAANKQFKAGNFKEAYESLRPLLLDPKGSAEHVTADLSTAVQCLNALGRTPEFDALIEEVIAARKDQWQALVAAAQQYQQADHYGQIVAGEFRRSDRRGGGRQVNAFERDRTRALQLLVQAMPLVDQNADENAKGEFYLQMARAFNFFQGGSWQLQSLTDLETLPDYEEGGYYGFQDQGAPADEEGNPVFYSVPESFEAASSDGQRWRWALNQAGKVNDRFAATADYEFASFLYNQFGVQTLHRYGFFFGRGGPTTADESDEEHDESGTYALHTLSDNETIARLAIGIRRFELPEEFNYIRIFQKLAAQKNSSYAATSVEQLAGIHENRRQYSKAAEDWRRAIEEFGKNDNRQQHLDQIVDNWGRFEPADSQASGTGATVQYRFRNGDRVQFTAEQIDIAKLLEDIKAYLKSNPQQLDWQQINIEQLGHRLLRENQQKYITRKVASWSQELKPRPNHVDDRITVSTPLENGGAYWLTAKMADGNTSHMVLWIDDMILVRKSGSEQGIYYLADAETGTPISDANIEFFGYQQEQVKGNKYAFHIKNFAEKTDENGLAYPKSQRLNNQYTWLTIARAPGEHLAFLGFNRMWFGDYRYPNLNETKVYTVTDRPLYRPGQTVYFKTWLRPVSYVEPLDQDLSGREVTIEVRDPRDESIHTSELKTDAYGAVGGEFTLPSSATLGQFSIHINDRYASNFRVEEYKKPEFEVTVTAPEKPVSLGDKFNATIEARYYFGSPVTEAKVKYKVMRTSYNDRWYPVGRWDWLYGRGYGWFASDYTWYPGWKQWGCVGPRPWWGFAPSPPPEVVAEQEVPIGPDGKVSVEIDTATAKALHGDQDHRYEIVAEVVDQSRRTIVGTGSVLAARSPFTVTTWTNRGYYNVGQAIEANFAARTLDGRPVQGTAEVTLVEVTYDENRQPVETPVRSWEVKTGEDGSGEQRIQASAPGQYRLLVKVTNSEGHTIEGGHVFIIRGEGFDGREFRFNNLELVLDRREYAVDEEVELMINTDRPGSTVLLYVRPSSGVYPKPQVLHLEGKSTVVPIKIATKDMPNFFVEALTISDGKVFTATQEVLVPPANRVANVEVVPSAKEYLPGEKGTIRLKFTDDEGNPFVGSTVLSVYDKALDAIAGGSNVPEIKEFFWQWRRGHHPQTIDSTTRYSYNLVPPGQMAMNNIGIFGETVVEEMEGVGFAGGGGVGGAAPELSRRGDMMQKSAMPAPSAAASDELRLVASTSQPIDNFVEPTIRSDFADSALWVGSVDVAEGGTAEVELTMPENLTAWLVKVWTVGAGTRVGQGEAEVVTRKNLIVRLQAPRFFVERDEVVLSANVHNYLESDKDVQVSLELDGPELEMLEESVRQVHIPAGGEVRVDWRVKAAREGEAIIRMLARSDEESDAVEQRFPVYVHGILRTESVAGAMRPDEAEADFTFEIPSERRAEQSRVEIRYSPTLAGAMIDALPYLVDYPYGCTEQTLNRFLPTVITQNILLEMGLDLEEIRTKQTNLNAQEIGDDRERAAQRVRRGDDHSPVFDEAKVAEMVNAGIDRLTEMQLSDGGWGWFSGWGERSMPHTTAYVVHGLQIAEQNNVALVPGTLERGIEWLQAYQQRQVELLKIGELEDKQDRPYKSHADNIDAFVYMVLVDADVANEEMRKYLYRDRTKLSVYAMCMFGLALHTQQQQEELDMILRNISQFLVEDDENQTAYLQLPEDNQWWYWYGSSSEANAYYLKLLAATDPRGRVASRLAKYLVNNRNHGWYWNSTRDTALCIEALAEFMQASGEDEPEMTVEVWVDGQRKKTVEITAANLFSFDNQVLLTGDDLTPGVHTVELRKQGTGPLYFNAYTTNFTLEDNIEAAGLEIKVQRRYYRLLEVEATEQVAGSRGQALKQRVEKYRREPLLNLAAVESGQLVEIELEIDSKNDYEYLMFEDMKAAGFEPVEIRSGYNGNELGAYVEFRDASVSFFVSRLSRGKHSVSYRLRAEVPGQFSALPTQASAMYAPELKANSNEIKLQIDDSPITSGPVGE